LLRIQLLAISLLALLLGPSALKAEGLISTVSFLPIPSGSTISVRLLDNSDSNLVLQKDFEQALIKKGYLIGKDGTFLFTFETRDFAGAWAGGGENRFIEWSNHDDQSGIEAPRVHINLFNSKRGGILNSSHKDMTRIVTPSSFQIKVTVDNKSNGKRIWEGRGSVSSHIGSNQETSRKVIPVLVESLGQTVSRKTFSLTQ